MDRDSKLDLLEGPYSDGWYDGAAALRDRFMDIAGHLVEKIGVQKFEAIMAKGIDPKTCNAEVWFAAQVICTVGMFWRELPEIYAKKRDATYTSTILDKIDSLVASGKW